MTLRIGSGSGNNILTPSLAPSVDSSTESVSAAFARGIQSTVHPQQGTKRLENPYTTTAPLAKRLKTSFTSEEIAKMTPADCEEFYELSQEIRGELKAYRQQYRNRADDTFQIVKMLCESRDFSCTDLGVLMGLQYGTILLYMTNYLNIDLQNEGAFKLCNSSLAINDLEQRFEYMQARPISPPTLDPIPAIVMTPEKIEEEWELPEELRIRLHYLRSPKTRKNNWKATERRKAIGDVCKYKEADAFLLSCLFQRSEESIIYLVRKLLKDKEIALCHSNLSVISPDQKFRYAEEEDADKAPVRSKNEVPKGLPEEMFSSFSI